MIKLSVGKIQKTSLGSRVKNIRLNISQRENTFFTSPTNMYNQQINSKGYIQGTT